MSLAPAGGALAATLHRDCNKMRRFALTEAAIHRFH